MGKRCNPRGWFGDREGHRRAALLGHNRRQRRQQTYRTDRESEMPMWVKGVSREAKKSAFLRR